MSKQIEHDEHRTQYLESVGLQVLRFRNKDIDTNFAGVCSYIDKTVKEQINSDPTDKTEK